MKEKGQQNQPELLSQITNDINNENLSLAEQTLTVVKRNGQIVPFHRERIMKAIELAFRDIRVDDNDVSLPQELIETIHDLTLKVTKQVLSLGQRGVSITVEGIQDIVEITLMKNGHHDVARGYIIYRDKHKAARESAISQLKIYRHDGTTQVRFNPMKISSSLERVFRSSHNLLDEYTPIELVQTVNQLTEKVVQSALEYSKKEELHIHHVQDIIEQSLMKDGLFTEAKEYILYRASKGQQVTIAVKKAASSHKKFLVQTEEGATRFISENEIYKKIEHACINVAEVSAKEVFKSAILNFYEGIKEKEIDIACIMAARAKVEKEPAYSKVTARLLLDVVYREAMEISSLDPALEEHHKDYFKKYIRMGINYARLSPKLLEYDLDVLAEALKLERDDQFTYLGLQTLYDRYFIHHQERRLETPQIFFMRVAMGLALNEDDKNKRAVEFYDVLSEFYFMSGTPTLFNSGTNHSQLSSCYLSTVMDDLSHIFKIISDDAQLSKWAGGLGNDWTNVRATGSVIKGTNGRSQGVIPFLKVANDTAVAVNQCFAPETLLYTSKGIRPIADVKIGDLVLGIGGTYREVTEKFVYNQFDPMVEIKVKHSIDPIVVTAGHPFYAIKNVPLEQSIDRTMEWLDKGKIECAWVEAKDLHEGDYVAQVVPTEIVAVEEFTEEDAHLYGILLGAGHLSKQGYEWGVSGNPQNDTHLTFVRAYLTKRGIHFWETGRGETYSQIRWSSGIGIARDGTTGQFAGSDGSSLPFTYDDIYDAKHNKHIAPRLSHLPRPHTLAMIQGLVETDGNVSRDKEVSFCNTSKALVEGMRYQLLRLGIPTAGNCRVRQNAHVGKNYDGSTIHFNGETTYDLRIPATKELATMIGCKPLTKYNWLTIGNFIFSRVKKVCDTKVRSIVCDLKVEGAKSYMTTSALASNGGKRKGALCSYLETWHLDIEDFLELRKNTGDERRRTHDMNTANWIPDLFMKRVEENGHWTLFSPSDTSDLHDLYGSAFEKRYTQYEKMTETGEIKHFKKVEALTLWRKMLSMLFETGHPWITFKDPSNVRSPQDHVGVVHSSNLCTEILLNTSKTETAVCNLGSINLVRHMTSNGLDEKRLAKTIETAIRMLDNVIEINFYPIQEALNANSKHRPIGLGIMGFQDALYMTGIPYASHEAVEFSDYSMEVISYYAILASTKLAKERGTYETYKGSKWDRGFLPIDTIDLLEKERGQKIDIDRKARMDWELVREQVKKYGMRNSNCMAIAPTATIANIVGVSASIEPTYKNLYVKSNLSGEFTIPNTYLVDKLKELNVWDDDMLDDLKYYDGSILEIERIPDDVKQIFLTCFEIDPDWVIACGAKRQKWLDMGQSLNLYMAEPSGKKLHQMYMAAWKQGLKTTYYLRSLGATQIEKSTTDINKRGLQPRWMKNKSASSNVTVDRDKPKACSIGGEGCESCQ
ncbi:MAG: ribonucleoside-diphosphate reductase subunit alpha [Chlamydiales bacterium]|nr:ribonucleoside-diphosphate reductase subunit alpha [Chlamydiales bacterium]